MRAINSLDGSSTSEQELLIENLIGDENRENCSQKMFRYGHE